MPVEKSPCGSAVAVVKGVDVSDQEMNDYSLYDGMNEMFFLVIGKSHSSLINLDVWVFYRFMKQGFRRGNKLQSRYFL